MFRIMNVKHLSNILYITNLAQDGFLQNVFFFKYKPVKNMFDDFVIVVPGGELVHFFFTPQDATSGILQ